MPLYAAAFMVFTMANVGLPGTSGFVGEFLTLAGTFRVNTWVAFLATTGVILSAAYALWLYRRVIFGKLEKGSLKDILDLSPREQLILAPLVVLTLLFGFFPAPIMDVTAASVDQPGGPTTRRRFSAAGKACGGFRHDARSPPGAARDSAGSGAILALLLVGVMAGERSTPLITGLSVALLVAAGLVLVLSPVEGVTFSGAFCL